MNVSPPPQTESPAQTDEAAASEAVQFQRGCGKWLLITMACALGFYGIMVAPVLFGILPWPEAVKQLVGFGLLAVFLMLPALLCAGVQYWNEPCTLARVALVIGYLWMFFWFTFLLRFLMFALYVELRS